MPRFNKLPRLPLAIAALGALLLSGAQAAAGPSVLDSWGTVATPPPPEVKPVMVDSAHTALLILDMNAVNCAEAVRPRCVRTLPAVQRLLTEARAHHMLVVYSAGVLTPTSPPPAPPAAIAPIAGEPLVRGPADKFFGSDLEKVLAARSVTTIIVTGTSAEGAVMSTSISAAFRNMNVVVPLDGMSSVTPFPELYTAWHLKNSTAAVVAHVTLSKSDLLTMH